MSVRRRFASPSTEKPRFLSLFQRKSPHNFCTKILHRTSGDRVGWSGCRLPQISPISTDKLHSACEESVFICRADGVICVIGKHPAGICVPQCDLWAKKVPHGPFRIPHLTLHVIDHPLPAKECRSAAPMARSVLLVSSPHGICVPQCDLWAYKTPAWPHSIIPHPTDHSTFNIPRSTFNIPHSTFHIIHSFSRLVSEQPLRLGTYCGGSSHASPHHLWCLRTPKVRIPVPPTVVRQRFSPCSISLFCNRNVKY